MGVLENIKTNRIPLILLPAFLLALLSCKPSIDEIHNRETSEIIQRVLKRNSNAVDIGAYEGEILAEFVRVAPDGKHFAFEPIPHLAADLRHNFTMPNVSIIEAALSDQEGTAEFVHNMDNEAYSGLRRRTYADENEQTEKIKVSMTTLDRILNSDLPIHLIKIDVEGAEFPVMRGAARTIRRYKPVIIFEHGIGGADHYGVSPQDVWSFLADDCKMKINILPRYLKNEPALTRQDFIEHFEKRLAYMYVAY